MLKIPERKDNLSWEYDEEADVLYISIGEPQRALGLDAGDGVIVRYREDIGEVVGITIIGMKERSLRAMGEAQGAPH
jgi:uncharacterized protein YuzE